MPFDGTLVTSPVIDLLQKAHKRLRKYGWIQNDEHDEYSGAYCLIGAIKAENPNYSLEDACVKALGFEEDSDLFEWNDTSKRKRSGVLRRITFAIQREKKRLLLDTK